VGYAELMFTITATAAPPPINHGLPTVYPNTRVKLDFGTNVNHLTDVGTVGFKLELLASNLSTSVFYEGSLGRVIGLTNDLAIFTYAQSWVIIRGTNELEGYLDTNIQGGPLEVSLGVPALAVVNYLFTLNETATNSSYFTNTYTWLTAIFTNQLSASAIDAITNVTWYLGRCLETKVLTETDVNSLIFTNSDITLQWPNGPPWATPNADNATLTNTETGAGVLNLPLDVWETDTNTLVFETFDDYLSPDDDYGLYFGFNYAAGSGTVKAASEVQAIRRSNSWGRLYAWVRREEIL
jgi:hypothetical protein